MTNEQFNLLIEYIDAAIDEKLADESASDEGLNSIMRKEQIKQNLKNALVNES